MKKNILAIAIASAVAAPVAMADAPTVYGQFNVAIDSYSDASTQNVVSRNSRVGIKGSEDLGNGLKAVYQWESGLDVATNEFNANMSNGDGRRNTFLGIAGNFGTVVMGRHDTPMRMIQPSDGFADSKAAGNNTSNFWGQKGSAGSGEDRLDEVVAYMSPNFNGISFAVASSTAGVNEVGSVNSYSVSYGTKKDGIFVAAGMTDVDGGRNNMRVTAQYKEAGLTGSVMYTTVADQSATQDGNAIVLSGAYKMGAITPRAKLAMVTYDKKDANGDDSAMNMALGADYALGKKTRVYAEFASLADTNRGAIADETVMSVGLFHKF